MLNPKHNIWNKTIWNFLFWKTLMPQDTALITSAGNLNNITSTAIANSEGQELQVDVFLLSLAAFPIIMTFGTVIGNIFVLIAVSLGNGHPTKLLIANLALADLLVGTIVMPLAVSNILTRSRWIYGSTLCKLWISLDVICSTASIVTLCAISCDRYIGVTRPLQYNVYVTRKRACYTCLAIWLISVTILLATVRWTKSEAFGRKCDVGSELRFVFESTIGSFFIPLAIICVLYYKIFRAAKRRYWPSVRSVTTETKPSERMRFVLPLRIHYGGLEKERQCCRAFQKQHKAAKTLAVVVGAFILCWTPFFALHSLSGLTETELVPCYVMDIFAWLGYFNSTLNPFIYGTTMKSFKRSFQRTAHVKFCSLSPFRLFSIRKDVRRSVRHRRVKQCSTRITTTELSFSETHASSEQLSDEELTTAIQCVQQHHNSLNARGSLLNEQENLEEQQSVRWENLVQSLDLKLYSLLIDSKSTDL